MRRILSGRHDECARIDEVVDRVEGGRSATLILRGEPGIGKTALLSYAVERASAFRILRATGVEAEADFAFAGLHELVRPVLDLLTAIPPVQARALGAALALDEGPPPGRLHIGAGVLSLLSAASDDRPVLCLIDDAEQLDDASVQALLFAARRLEAERIGMIWASDDDTLASWMPALPLAGLALDDAASLTIERSDRPVAPSVARAIAEAAGGNPLACVVVPRALSDEQLTGGTTLPHPLPVAEELSAAFTARATGLSPSARSALLRAAASDTATTRVIVPAADAGEDTLTELETLGLLVMREGRYGFAHPLLRSAIYQQATPSERRAAHLQIAERLEGDDRYRAHRAWHRSAASPGPDEAVAHDLEDAARAMAAGGAAATGSLLFERSARFSVDDEHRSAMMLEAAESAGAAGQIARAIALADGALTSDRDPMRRLRLGILSCRLSEDLQPGQQERLRRDAEAVAPADPVLAGRAIAEVAFGRADADDPHRALELAPDDPSTRILADLALARAADPEDPPRAAAALSAACDLALEPGTDAEMRIRVADVAVETGADEVLARVLATLEGSDVRDVASELVPRWLARRAWLRTLQGAWRDAEIDLDDAQRRLDGSGRRTTLAIVIAHLALLDAWRGRPVAERLAALAAIHTIPEPAVASARDRIEGVAALASGDARGAATQLRSWYASTERSTLLPACVTDVIDVVEAAVRAGDEAEAVIQAIADHDDAGRATRAWATGLTSTADEDRLSDALTFFEAQPRPFAAARIRLHLAERIRRGGERVRAREHLRSAIATFDRLGAAPWSERARRELRASGEHVARYDASRMDELTPQELQVARLIAEGATYKEAATALFLAPKTIEFHLGKVYRKLGIASRGELAAQMHRMELNER